MSTRFPMGWVFVALATAYVVITGQREILLYGVIGAAFIYGVGLVNTNMGKDTTKKIG